MFLIVNADDYGYSPGVSRGILHRNTVARSISRLNARIKAM